MNDGKRSKKRRSKGYVIKPLCFLIIMVGITIGTVFAAINPVTSLVHKVESVLPEKVRDIELNDSFYDPFSQTDKSISDIKLQYGDKIANITSENTGLNCSVYYGANRVSMQNGVGISGNSSIFGEEGVCCITGYCESYFAPITSFKKGDVITITTNYGEFKYKVEDAKYLANNTKPYKETKDSMLVLCGICSDFSNHSGENYYVYASYMNQEGN